MPFKYPTARIILGAVTDAENERGIMLQFT